MAASLGNMATSTSSQKSREGGYKLRDRPRGDDDGHKVGRSPAPSSASTPAPALSDPTTAERRATTDGHLSERRPDEACFAVAMVDTWGDGWDNAFYTVFSSSSNEVVASGTPTSGSSATEVVCVDVPACYSSEVSAGDFPSETPWTIGGGALSGGAPYDPPSFGCSWVLS